MLSLLSLMSSRFSSRNSNGANASLLGTENVSTTETFSSGLNRGPAPWDRLNEVGRKGHKHGGWKRPESHGEASLAERSRNTADGQRFCRKLSQGAYLVLGGALLALTGEEIRIS